MDLSLYLENRRMQKESESSFRETCFTCFQPLIHCYCGKIKKFDPRIKFAILIHHIERRRRIATGRMSHLCLENSELILGQDYSQNKKVNELLADPSFDPVILYPGKNSTNITNLDFEGKKTIFKNGKTPLVFVIDGTWATAKKMMKLSGNLKSVKQICFTPSLPSQFRVRKQPAVGCYSTLEAIHHTLDLLAEPLGMTSLGRIHDGLLEVFNHFVDQQVRYVKPKGLNKRNGRSS